MYRFGRRLYTLTVICFFSIIILTNKRFTGLFEKSLVNADNKELDSRFNIFFIETNHYRKSFGIRQLCAIESAAKHNPNARVIVKALSARINVPEIVSTYPNIEWSLLDLNDAFNNTPLIDWWLSGVVVQDNNYTRFAHLADALRYTLIYKYGGVYSDLDTITLKNFEPLTKYSGFGGNRDNPWHVISNGFFHFTKNHPFLLELLKKLPQVYDPKVWGSIGPNLIRPSVKAYCNVKTFVELMHLGVQIPEMYQQKNNKKVEKKIEYPSELNSCNITIFPHYVCYPYQMHDMYTVFKHNASVDVFRTMHSYSVHFFGKLSTHATLEWNEYSIYELFASANCPITHNLLRLNSTIKKHI